MWVERTKVYRHSFTEPKNVFFRQSYLLPKERQGWGPSRNTSTLYVEVVQVGGIEHLDPIAISHFSLTARYRSDEEDYFKGPHMASLDTEIEWSLPIPEIFQSELLPAVAFSQSCLLCRLLFCSSPQHSLLQLSVSTHPGSSTMSQLPGGKSVAIWSLAAFRQHSLFQYQVFSIHPVYVQQGGPAHARDKLR
jgi:hypothetical protein